MNRRAILIFAESLGLDLARRRLPQFLRPLFTLSAVSDPPLPADVHLFSSGLGNHAAGCALHRQRGRSFAEKLENAVEEIKDLGYEEIVIVGRDCPHLNETDIASAFDALQSRRLVLGPDHRGGCYLIALRAIDRHLLRRVRWNQNTDCAELRTRCGWAEVFLLAVKHDLDSWADVQIVARLGGPLSRFANFALKTICAAPRAIHPFVDLAAQFVRVRGQIPPPAVAG